MIPDAARRLRPATESDVPGLLALYRHLIPEDPPLDPTRAAEIFQRFMGIDGSAIWLACVGDAPVASCALVVVPNLTRGGAPYGLIENVVTHGDHRRRGHGRAVLDAACAAAWGQGCYKVMLMTGSQTPGTLGFYRDTGFAATKTGFERRRIPCRAAT